MIGSTRAAQPLAIPPVRVRFEKRVTVAAFVWVSTELLVVDEVKRAFEAANAEGIEYLEVQVRIVGTTDNYAPNSGISTSITLGMRRLK